MLTVDFARFPVTAGQRVLDLGCGGGRHAYEVYRRGADIVAFDLDHEQLVGVHTMLAAMAGEGDPAPAGSAGTVSGTALGLPFPDASFDRVIAAEILEHLQRDEEAIAEIVRVVRPGGLVAVTVPRWFPERVCWALSDAYHQVDGGHIRIYRRHGLERKLRRAGLEVLGGHHAHALHAPYWWLRCALDAGTEEHALARTYHRLLVWDLLRRPMVTRAVEQALNPVVGKSLVIYARKPEALASAA